RIIANRPPFYVDDYPLTESARTAAAGWIPVEQVDTGCAPKAMPRVMSNMWPMEFHDEGQTIRLQMEEFDVVRLIHLDRAMPPDVEPSPWGYSVGRWVDGDLVVETRGVNSRYFGTAGIPLSDDVEMIERFSLAQDEQRLDYALTVMDPATFTEPVTIESFWEWRPGEQVKPYNCVDTPGSWSDADR
ncbi:MAG TPA: hypothetical protein VIV14_13150, partial [Gammaproteobacteria bacterium]